MPTIQNIPMELKINDHKKIFAIQEDFNSFFPYLKLEFFSKPRYSVGATAKKLLSTGSRPLAECRTIKHKEDLIIYPSMTVIDLEKKFREVFGLGIQVFRKSGKAWLETTLTDNWTLEEQNRQGEALSKG